MIVTVYNRAGTEILNRISNYEGLRFESDRIGGFTTAEFSVSRSILNQQSDLQVYNQVVIEEGSEVPWEGYISEPSKTSPAGLDVACLGWSGLLTETGLSANQASQKMSTFANSVMLADGTVSPFITAGTISTSDYTCPAIEDIAPWKFYSEALDNYNKWNDWRYGIWEGKKFYLAAPQTTAKWIVLAKDAPGFQITDSTANFWNKVIYSYSTNGSNKIVGTVSDATSISTYGRTVCKALDIPGRATAGQASAIATILLTKGKTMTVMGQIVTDKVYSATTHELVPVHKVRGGDPIKVQNYLTAVSSPGSTVDEVTSFEIKTVQYERKTKQVTITPKDWDSGLETKFARMESR